MNNGLEFPIPDDGVYTLSLPQPLCIRGAEECVFNKDESGQSFKLELL